MHLITEGFDCEVCTLYLPSKEVLESHKRFFSILRNGKQATTFRDTLRKHIMQNRSLVDIIFICEI